MSIDQSKYSFKNYNDKEMALFYDEKKLCSFVLEDLIYSYRNRYGYELALTQIKRTGDYKGFFNNFEITNVTNKKVTVKSLRRDLNENSNFINQSSFDIGNITIFFPHITMVTDIKKYKHYNMQVMKKKNECEIIEYYLKKINNIKCKYLIQIKQKIEFKCLFSKYSINKYVWGLTIIVEEVDCEIVKNGIDYIEDKINEKNPYIEKHKTILSKEKKDFITKISQHAAMIIEGVADEYFSKDMKIKNIHRIKKDEKFIYKSHLLTSGVTSSIIDTEKKVKYIKKSKTWLVTSEKMKKMLDKIQVDIESKQGWNYFGEYSCCNRDKEKYPNCLQYVRNTVEEVEIKLSKSILEYLIPIPKQLI